MILSEPKLGQAQVQIDFKRYLNIITSHWFKIALFVLFMVMVANFIALLIPPTYRATATLLIESQANKAISIEEVYSLDSNKKEYYQTQFEILRSTHISEKVIHKLGIAAYPEFNYLIGQESVSDKLFSWLKSISILHNVLPEKPQNPEMTTEAARQAVLNAFKKNLTISPITNTQLVRIHFTSKDPMLAAKVANSIGEAYIESNLEARLLATQTASSWITERLVELKNKLDQTELNLSNFLRQEGLIELNNIDELAGTEVTNLTIRVAEARDRRVAAESMFSLLKGNEGNTAAMLSVPEISNHPQVRDVKIAEIDAERKVSELAKRYGPRHDKMVQAIAQLDAVRSRARSIINELARSIGKELDNAKKQEIALAKTLNSKKEEYQNIIGKRSRYESLKRDVVTSKQLYEMFLNRQKETSATSDFAANNARFTDLASIPQQSFAPKTFKIALIVGAFSLIFAIAFTLVLDAYRSTFDVPDDVERKLGLTIAGALPKIKAPRFKKHPIDHSLYFDPNLILFSEAIRSLRTSIVLANHNKGNIVAITSTSPAEGKTSISLCLAQAFASTKKTLLIDCDLRSPAIKDRYDLPSSQAGLTQVLLKGEAVDEHIFHDTIAGLDVLPAGELMHNPQELVGSSAFANLLKDLSEKYEMVILDTPPISLVSDSLLLGRLAGGMMLVVKAQATTEAQLEQSVRQLKRHNIPLNGIILNQVGDKYVQHKSNATYGYLKPVAVNPEHIPLSTNKAHG